MANAYGITSILLAVTAGILILLMTQTTPTEAGAITYEPYVYTLRFYRASAVAYACQGVKT